MTDKRVVMLVVALLGAVCLLGLTGTIFLIWAGVDAAAVALVGTPTATALGGLTALLVSTKAGSNLPPPPKV